MAEDARNFLSAPVSYSVRRAARMEHYAFSDLELDQRGISSAHEILPWEELQEFMPKNGTVTLRKKAKQL